MIETEKKSCSLKMDSKDSKYLALETSSKLQLEICKGAVDRTAKSCQRKWYESPYFNMTLGAALCGAAVGVGASLK